MSRVSGKPSDGPLKESVLRLPVFDRPWSCRGRLKDARCCVVESIENSLGIANGLARCERAKVERRELGNEQVNCPGVGSSMDSSGHDTTIVRSSCSTSFKMRILISDGKSSTHFRGADGGEETMVAEMFWWTALCVFKLQEDRDCKTVLM